MYSLLTYDKKFVEKDGQRCEESISREERYARCVSADAAEQDDCSREISTVSVARANYRLPSVAKWLFAFTTTSVTCWMTV
jgi:hypothetical protein